MHERAEQLFQQLQNAAAIRALIGQSEDVHFDCKEWPSKDEDAQKTLAKAACGLTNAEGGVLVIGMRAKPLSKEEPDLIESAVPVSNTTAVKSRLLDLIGNLVEPGIEDIKAVEVNDPQGSQSGFVVAYIPASNGLPRRSRKDWKFYLRIGSGTFPMEYFQIAEMFGQRPQPKLELILEEEDFFKTSADGEVGQYLWLDLFNTGRGIAKFPSVRFVRSEKPLKVYTFGIDGNCSHGLPWRASDNKWVVFRGGVDDVIYPGTKLRVTKLMRECSGLSGRHFMFNKVTFSAEISCEGMETRTVDAVLKELQVNSSEIRR
jgi:hypothetical protein